MFLSTVWQRGGGVKHNSQVMGLGLVLESGRQAARSHRLAPGGSGPRTRGRGPGARSQGRWRAWYGEVGEAGRAVEEDVSVGISARRRAGVPPAAPGGRPQGRGGAVHHLPGRGGGRAIVSWCTAAGTKRLACRY